MRKYLNKIREDKVMASALMELMKPEVEKYAEERIRNYSKERDLETAKSMIQHGSDNEYIRLLTSMTDKEIDELRRIMK